VGSARLSPYLSFRVMLGLHFRNFCAWNLKLKTSKSFTNAWYWWPQRTTGISSSWTSRWNRGPSLIFSGDLEQFCVSFACPLTGLMIYSAECLRLDIVLAVIGCCWELTAACFSSIASCGGHSWSEIQMHLCSKSMKILDSCNI